jgi:hypothetical protein
MSERSIEELTLDYMVKILKMIQIDYRLVAATKEIGLEVNADKTKYMVMSRDQKAGRNHRIKIDNSSFERVEEYKYLGTKFKESKFYSGRS